MASQPLLELPPSLLAPPADPEAPSSTLAAADLAPAPYGSSAGAYSSAQGAGGKLRSSRRASLSRSKRSTPYDRPASGRHATPGGAAAAAPVGASIAFRLVDSASRLISSSATYLFSSFFGRRPLAIANGDEHSAGAVVAEEEQEKELKVSPDGKHDATLDPRPSSTENFPNENCAGTRKQELDLTQVEEILKQQTLSREQVERLTKILQSRVVEENAVVPQSEAQRWREELKKARDEFTPVNVARAYMGERTSRPSALTTSIRGTGHQINRVAEVQPPLADDRYITSPVLKSWTRNSAVPTPRRSSVLDADWVSWGPIRRTRQKSLTLANSSPYAKGMSGASLPPRAFASPPIQSSQTARKILETLEKLSPSPKRKPLEEELKMATERSASELIPDTSIARARKSMQITDFSRLPKIEEPGPSSGKLSLEFPASSEPEIEPTLTFGSPAVKESNWDTEKMEVKSGECPAPRIFSRFREASQSGFSSAVKPSSSPMPTSRPCTTTNASVVIAKAPLFGTQTRPTPETAVTFTTAFQFSSPPGSSSQPGGSSDFKGSSKVAMKSEKASLLSWTPPKFTFSSAVQETLQLSSVSAAPAATSLDTPGSFAAVMSLPVLPAASIIEDLPESKQRGTVAMESPGADRLPEGNLMPRVSKAREPEIFAMPSNVASFQFGSSASASISSSPGHAFSNGAGSLSSSTSIFSFAVQSGMATAASSSTSYRFGDESGSSSPGQLFGFGAPSSPPPASPFSFPRVADTVPSLTYGSSSFATPSALPAITATSLPSFSVTSSAPPTFSFGSGSTASSSSSASSSGQLFGFGVQPTSSPSSLFSTSGATIASPSFTFASSPAPVASPPPTFTFGGGVSTSVSSGFTSAGQSFSFGSQINPSASSPFSPAGSKNSAPSPFVSSSSVVTVPTFSFNSGAASYPSSTSAFGAQSVASQFSSLPAPFTFGDQTGASTAGQSLGLGEQPTALSPSPFASAGVSNTFSQAGPDFSGGFTFGPTGGEKGGRKFIKAKRIAGAKKGK